MQNEIFDISNHLEKICDKIKYYINIVHKYGYEINILNSLDPIIIPEQEKLYDNLIKDKELIKYIQLELIKKYGKIGIVYFYNAIYFNLVEFIKNKLDITGLKLIWNEKEIIDNKIELLIYINETYYGKINIFEREYQMAEPTELLKLIDDVNNLKKNYTEDDEEISNLYSKLTDSKKSVFEKVGVYKKDNSKIQRQYDYLVEKKFRNKLLLDEAFVKYEKILNEMTQNRFSDKKLNKKLIDELNVKVFEIDSFPTIDNYEPEPVEEENKEYIDIDFKFKYNE